MLAFLTKNINDIVYLSLLLLSVAIGPYYRAIKSVQTKKWVGSFLGILLIVIVSGYNSLHPFISIAIGIVAIKISGIR